MKSYDLLKQLSTVYGVDKVNAVMDTRLPTFGSFHQKTFVVKSGGKTSAYVGGIDITHDRMVSSIKCMSC